MSSATKLFKIRIQTTLPRTASRKDASCPPKVTAGKALAHERCCWRRNAGLVRETQRNVPRQSCPAYCAEHLCRGPCLRYRDNFASAQQRRAWPRQAEVLSRSGARGYSGAFLSSDKKTSGVVCCVSEPWLSELSGLGCRSCRKAVGHLSDLCQTLIVGLSVSSVGSLSGHCRKVSELSDCVPAGAMW